MQNHSMTNGDYFTKLLQIKHPLIQAPMAGGITTPELVAAVSNHGALGSLGAAYLQADDLRDTIKSIQLKTNQATEHCRRWNCPIIASDNEAMKMLRI